MIKNFLSKKLLNNLILCRQFSQPSIKSVTNLNDLLKYRIQISGPITVADYMKECLTNSQWGYYTKKDVFGVKGDFTTSPEITQVFGELVGIWIVNEWLTRGSPRPFHLVEFGPGRGTLMADILRVTKKFPELYENLSIHLIENSPLMKNLQRANLESHVNSSNNNNNSLSTVNWIDEIKNCDWLFSEEKNEQTTCFLAHEFLDALPIHMFQKRNEKWHEMMIGVDDKGKFRYVLSKTETPGSAIYLPRILHLIPDELNQIEVSVAAISLAEQLGNLCHKKSHFGLFIDFGHDADASRANTFRAYRKHRESDPLCNPGEVDLTADVNFAFIKNALAPHVAMHGPVSQAQFLIQMGLPTRLKMLVENNKNEEQCEQMIRGCEKLIDPKEMGERFKFLAFHGECDRLPKLHVPFGFLK